MHESLPVRRHGAPTLRVIMAAMTVEFELHQGEIVAANVALG
jgi:hypothetical protein